jgi:hypothetical protein
VAADPSEQLAGLRFTPLTAGAVLQRGVPATVSGSGAAAGATVNLVLAGSGLASTTADGQGNWSVALPAQPVRWDVKLVARSSGAAVQTTVSFGEVVLCSVRSAASIPRPPDCYPAAAAF